MIHPEYIFAHVKKPAFYRFTKVIPTYDGWHRVNIYSQVEKCEPNRDPVWGLSIVKSFVVREVDDQYLDFHPTTPPEDTLDDVLLPGSDSHAEVCCAVDH